MMENLAAEVEVIVNCVLASCSVSTFLVVQKPIFDKSIITTTYASAVCNSWKTHLFAFGIEVQ